MSLAEVRKTNKRYKHVLKSPQTGLTCSATDNEYLQPQVIATVYNAAAYRNMRIHTHTEQPRSIHYVSLIAPSKIFRSTKEQQVHNKRCITC